MCRTDKRGYIGKRSGYWLSKRKCNDISGMNVAVVRIGALQLKIGASEACSDRTSYCRLRLLSAGFPSVGLLLPLALAFCPRSEFGEQGLQLGCYVAADGIRDVCMRGIGATNVTIHVEGQHFVCYRWN